MRNERRAMSTKFRSFLTPEQRQKLGTFGPDGGGMGCGGGFGGGQGMGKGRGLSGLPDANVQPITFTGSTHLQERPRNSGAFFVLQRLTARLPCPDKETVSSPSISDLGRFNPLVLQAVWTDSS